MPSGVYFTGDYSISAWVNVQSPTGQTCRIIDCGTSSLGIDNVLVSYTYDYLAFFSVVCTKSGQSFMVSAS